MADPIVNVTTRVFNIEVTKKENQVVISSPGPQGPVGVGFPIGGTAGQFLTKIDGTNYNTQWITLPSYQPLDSDLTGIAALSQNGLLRKTLGNWVMDSTTYLVASDLSPYLTITSAAATYSPLTHNHNGVYQPVGNYLTSYTETDPIFLASPAYTITSQQIANWNNPTVFPSQSGNNGKFLTTNGSITSWATVDALPSQSGNNGKYLTTNGLSASWGILDLSLYLTTANAASTYQPIGNYLTSYNETDTLSSVTGRGSSTGSAISITNTTQSTSYSTGSLIVGGGVGIAKDLFVQGNLVLTGNIDINGTITGNLTQINVTDLNVTDSLIYLGSENLTSDTLDIGFNGAYRPLGDISGHKHTGFARDHNDSGIWKLFSGAAEITGNDIDFGLNDVNVNFDQLKIKSLIVTDSATTRTNLGLAIGTNVQAYSSLLSAIVTLGNGTGLLKNTAGTWSYDNNTYALSSSLSSYAPLSNPVFLTAISFEGTTVNNNETHLTVVDPTQDNTITLPNDTGTVALTKDTAKLASANAFTVGGHTITSSGSPTVVPLTITGDASQTANLMTIGNTTFRSTGGITTTSQLNATSALCAGTSNYYQASLNVVPLNATIIGTVIRGAASQTANLQEWQNSAGTALGGANANAQIFTGSTTPITTAIGAAGAITSAAYVSATSATFTVAQTAQIFAVGQVITITGVSGGNYNQVVTVTGVATVSAGTTYTFTATGAGFTNVAGTGGAFALSPSGTGTTATINLISASNLAIGDLINVSGFTGVTTYNTGTGVYAVVTAVSNTAPYTVSYANTSTGTAANGAINIPYQATITARSLGTATLALNAPTSYTGNLINFLINGVSFGRVDSVGIRMPSIANPSAFANSNINFQTTGTVISASTSASTSIPLKIQNANAGTITGDLTQWLNNTGATILASVGFDGAIRTTVGFGSVTSGKTFGYPNFDTGAFGFYGGTASDKKLVVRGTGAAGSYTQTADLQQWQTYDGTTATTVAKVDYLGNITAVSITLSSDERLKKNITPISGALDKVNKLNGYTFNRLDGNQREVGVIAQEVIEVMPELVKESDGYYSVAYPNMVALLIESIKELNREIEELKNK